MPDRILNDRRGKIPLSVMPHCVEQRCGKPAGNAVSGARGDFAADEGTEAEKRVCNSVNGSQGAAAANSSRRFVKRHRGGTAFPLLHGRKLIIEAGQQRPHGVGVEVGAFEAVENAVVAVGKMILGIRPAASKSDGRCVHS